MKLKDVDEPKTMTLRGKWTRFLNKLPFGLGKAYSHRLLVAWRDAAYTEIILRRCVKEGHPIIATLDEEGNIVFDDGKIISWQWVFLLAMGEPVKLDDML